MAFCLGLMLLANQLALPQNASRVSTADNVDPWAMLSHVPWRRTYTFVNRDRDCYSGQVEAVSSRSVTIRSTEPLSGYVINKRITLDRAGLLRIEDGPKPIDVIYSGRNSWSDVLALQKIGPE